MLHKPVLLEETLRCLNLKPGMTVVDGTLGSGGHSLEILKAIGPSGKLIGLDQDPEAIERCKKTLAEYGSQIELVHANFSEMGGVLDSLNIPTVDAVILDIGISSDQLGNAERGFSFDSKGPLDMRMNPKTIYSASDFVNQMHDHELEKIFREFGEERYSRQFAAAICRERSKRAIESTQDLVDAVETALPHHLRFKKGQRPSWARRHPATKIFQALRIAVNDELGVLQNGLEASFKRLNPEGRLAIISFHSLEDRIVKNRFRELCQKKLATAVTKKPIVASREETLSNPRSRSAKLRAIIKQNRESQP